MSGGKGGSTTSQVEVPAWLENAAQTNLARADQLSTIGYTPYYGADVAALTPMQQASMQNTNQGASAFGMAAPTDAMAGMPQAQTFAGGVQGYSSGGLYDQALSELQTRRPGQFAALNAPFINPYTGAPPAAPFGGGSLMPANQMISQGALSSQDRAYRNSLAANRGGDGAPSTITIGGVAYDPRTQLLSPEQRAVVESNTPEGTAARIALEDVAMSNTGGQATGFWDDVGNFMSNGEPTFDNPSSRGSYGGSLVTGSPSGATYGIPGIGGGILDNFMPFNDQMDRNTAAGADAAGSVLQPDGTYDISSWYPTTQPIAPAPAVLPKDNNNDDNDRWDNTPDPWRAGGNSQAETDLINSNMSDEDFWNEVEASDPRNNDSGGSSGGGKLICTAMNKMGLLPDDIYALDAEFGLKVNREDRMLGDGYRLWALPVSEYIKRDTIGAKALRTFMRPITLAWAKEMAHKMRPEEYKTNYAGKVIMAIGHPICRAIGYAFIGGLAKKDA
jgi:hypothetical protein